MHSGFGGRLFGPDRPQDGEPVRASFIGTRLRIDGRETRDAEASAIEVEAAGFEQDDVLMSWHDRDGDWGLIVSDAAAKQVLLAAAPPVLARPLGRWRRSVGVTRGIWRAAIGSAIALVVGAGLLWWQYDAVIAWTAARISPETERRMGAQMMQGVVAEGRTIREGQAHATLTEIGAKLTVGARHPYHWYLIDDPQVNAFALPGGYIVVNVGLIDATRSADELAAVLAHEVQHVEQRHSLQSLLHQLGWATLLTVVVGDASAVTSVVLIQLGTTTFSRELEAQADLAGVQALARAGIPPAAMAEFFRTIKQRTPEVPTLLSTHPATDDRIAAIEVAVAAAPCTTCTPLAYDWDAVRESLRTDGFIKRARSARPPRS